MKNSSTSLEAVLLRRRESNALVARQLFQCEAEAAFFLREVCHEQS